MKANEIITRIRQACDAIYEKYEGNPLIARTDAFIEKSCEFLKDHLAGYDICEDDIERSVESFKLAMTL